MMITVWPRLAPLLGDFFQKCSFFFIFFFSLVFECFFLRSKRYVFEVSPHNSFQWRSSSYALPFVRRNAPVKIVRERERERERGRKWRKRMCVFVCAVHSVHVRVWLGHLWRVCIHAQYVYIYNICVAYIYKCNASTQKWWHHATKVAIRAPSRLCGDVAAVAPCGC